MKRVVLVICLLLMSVYVTGYTYEVEMKITDDNKVILKKTFEMNKEETTKLICGDSQCEYGETEIRNAISPYVNSDITDENTKMLEEISLNDNSVKVYHSYELGDIDDHVGPGHDKFDLLHSNFNYDLFTINGLNYKSNIIFTVEEGLVLGTFKVDLPYKMDSCNATKKDDKTHTYEWDLTSTNNINFIYKSSANTEIAGDKEYGKIKFNKYMFIALGVVGGLVVILAFVNIIKKDKNHTKQVESPVNTPVFNNEIFNERAAVSKPSDVTSDVDTFVPLDETKHEDKISNKFLDDSFADSAPQEEQPSEAVTISDQVIKTPIVEEKPTEEKPMEEPKIEEEIIEESVEVVEEEQPSEPIQNDMSALAFGGTPIEDKNINEIK